MTILALETQLTEIMNTSSIPAIEAMNQYMLTLSNDFPIQSFFKKNSIQQVVAIDPIFVWTSPALLDDYQVPICNFSNSIGLS